MIRLSQRDIRWGGKPIGKTNVLIRDKGCVITNISMLSDYFGQLQHPSWMAKNLEFTSGALLIWKSIDKVLNFKFEWRFYSYQEQRILAAIKDPKKACLLEIKKSHWVIALKKVPFGYWVADPWDGKNKFMNTSTISGGAILTK